MKSKLFVWFCLLALFGQQLSAQLSTAAASQQAQSATKGVVIPEGTMIQLTMREPVSSKLSEVGDEVIATVKKDVVVEGTTLLKAGTEVVGRVTVVKPAKRPLKGGQLHLSFDRIRLEDGLERKLTAIVQSASDFTRDEKISGNGEGTLKGGKSGGDVLKNVGTAAGIGGAAATIIILAGRGDNVTGLGIRGISGGSAAAAAGVIGGSLIAGVLLTKGKEVRLDSGALVRLKLERPLSVE
ncbi:MAG: hypothetical protein JST84_20140 [Acidobacteria bacterium]|nr:hypothetical protein [Acidobacteriota bacterium]